MSIANSYIKLFIGQWKHVAFAICPQQLQGLTWNVYVFEVAYSPAHQRDDLSS